MIRSFHSRTAAALVALCAVVAGCKPKQQRPQRPPVPVTVAAAKRVDVPYTIDANGLVTPMRTANVSAQVDGIIRRVLFREGQDVEQGQILFEIDARPYEAAYKQALANLARDKATAENAAREAQRYGELVKQDFVTQEQADQQRTTAAAATATVSADEAQVANAKFALDNTTIRAPIAGRTGSLLVREGNLVHANGTTPLVVINQLSPILVRFAVPATQLPLLQRYGSAGNLPVVATPSSAQAGGDTTSGPPGTSTTTSGLSPGDPPGAQRPGDQPTMQFSVAPPAEGQLFFIDNAVDTATGTVLLKATFPNTSKTLWVGQFVATTVRLFVEQHALVVPSQAVVTGQQGTFVYVVSDSGTAQQRRVRVERTAGPVAVIASGVTDGDRVVTDGQSRLTPNAKVAINNGGGGPGGPGGRGGSNAGVASGRGGGRSRRAATQ